MTEWLRLDPSGAFVPAAGAATGEVVAVESWLVDGGRVRGLDRHADRFARGAAAAGLDPGDPWPAVAAALPTTGRWFPRLELRAGAEPRLALRPAPDRAPTVVAWIADGPDPRRAGAGVAAQARGARRAGGRPMMTAGLATCPARALQSPRH